MLVIDPEECIDCFAGSEQLVTRWGLRSFEELEDRWCTVLTDSGFQRAHVKRFRRRPLVDVELAPAFEERTRYGGVRLTTRNGSRYRRTVLATPTHSWLLADGDRTESLAAGQFVPAMRTTPRRAARRLCHRRVRSGSEHGDELRRPEPPAAVALSRDSGSLLACHARRDAGARRRRHILRGRAGQARVHARRRRLHWQLRGMR